MFDGKFEWLNAGGMFGGFDSVFKNIRWEFWKSKGCSMEVNEDLRSRCSRIRSGDDFKWSNAGV